MDLGLRDRVALVTAASKGLGRATAIALAEEGARLVICARGEEALREAESEIAKRSDVLAVVEDVTQIEAPVRLVDMTLERFGRLDVVVPNAGGPPPGRTLDFDDAAILAAMNANLLTSIRLVRAAAPHLRAGGWGRICCITSYTIVQASDVLPLSNTARTALWAWAKTAAAELAPDGITLNLALPGPHATDRMIALGGSDAPMGDPADFGRVVAFLCSEPARYINGAALVVDGGATRAL